MARRPRRLGERLRRARARARYELERLVSVTAGLALVALALWVSLCTPPPPAEPENLCAVFDEKRLWYESARETHSRWGLPEPVLLAIVFQESSFRADARPKRPVWLGFIPGFRPSSAYGFGQVLDGTWEDYLATLDERQRTRRRRDRFSDVADFVGWYAKHIHRRTGITPAAPRELYLAYHEGPGGYQRGEHRSKRWLLEAAERVAQRARRYEAQYAGCRADLENPSWFPLL